MIEATEVHETRIAKPIIVKLEVEKPIRTGISLGVGFILAPFAIIGLIYLIIYLAILVMVH